MWPARTVPRETLWIDRRSPLEAVPDLPEEDIYAEDPDLDYEEYDEETEAVEHATPLELPAASPECYCIRFDGILIQATTLDDVISKMLEYADYLNGLKREWELHKADVGCIYVRRRLDGGDSEPEYIGQHRIAT